MTRETCNWCGADVDADRGFRVYAPAQGQRAAFCRLEHIVPWAMRGARRRGGPAWTASPWPPAAAAADGPAVCSHCGEPLTGAHIVLVHHRDAERIVDRFRDVEHMRAWALRGGRWG